jgi:hypothetical protein
MQNEINNCEHIALTMDLELHETNHNLDTKEDSKYDASQEENYHTEGPAQI